MQVAHSTEKKKGLGFHNILLVIASAIFIGSLVFSIFTPSLDFSVNTQSSGGETVLVALTHSNQQQALKTGDIIEAVNGKIVRNKAEFWFQLLFADRDDTEITIKRFGTRFQRHLTASSFAAGGLPLGLRRGDKPVRMTKSQGGEFIALEDIDFEALKELVENHCQEVGCLVTFKRTEDLQNFSIKLGVNVKNIAFVLASIHIHNEAAPAKLVNSGWYRVGLNCNMAVFAQIH